jgi:RNA polymerase sigma factor (sigma-70 family)
MKRLEIKDAQGWLLVQKCLEGDSHCHQELRKRITQILRPKLLRRGASQTEAEDIIADLTSDCVATLGGGGSLLRKYSGKGSLDGWLLKSALHRFLTLRRTQKFDARCHCNGTQRNGTFEVVASPGTEQPDEALDHLIRKSLLNAFAACSAEERIMLRLVHCEGVTQRELSRMWGWHECKISRRLARAIERIKSETLSQVALAEPTIKITWEDLLRLCDTLQIRLLLEK